jgi:hypothetical protein
MDDRRPRPNFFIVGAPKCATTSLWRYLAGHPEVFVSAVKEPHHFGTDVRAAVGLDRRDRYLELFARAGPAKAIGEASVWYLRSEDAAREIAEFEQGARIIAMVREPVSQIRSLHHHYVARGIEDLTDFAAAVAAGPARFGGRIAGRPGIPAFLDYRLVPRYAEQLERYFAVFPREQVHVIVQEEFGADTAGGFRDVLRFLGVGDSYQPEAFERYLESRRSRTRGITRWLFAPPQPLRRLVRRVVPPLFRARLHGLIRRPFFMATSVKAPPSPIAPALEDRLRAEFAPEVERLARLIDRPDLPTLWGYR